MLVYEVIRDEPFCPLPLSKLVLLFMTYCFASFAKNGRLQIPNFGSIQKPKNAIINDLNDDLMLVYEVIRDDVESLIMSLQEHENTSDLH